MVRINVDINETEIFNLYPEVLETLLKDHTTGRNIFWAADSYAHRGDGFQYSDAITVGHIIGENGMVIRPRALKSKDEQTERTKEMAEVFTPSWVCNAQNNLVDEAWFGRKDVFNTVDDTQHTWMANPDRIAFPNNKTWKSYVRATRMEITCGEAPYLVSRYDTTTGLPIELNQRIGMLDRKLRVVSENTGTSGAAGAHRRSECPGRGGGNGVCLAGGVGCVEGGGVLFRRFRERADGVGQRAPDGLSRS